MIDLSDPISRQQTITALRALSDEDGYINVPHEVVTDVVRGLPPVRSEHEQTTQPEQGKTDKLGVKTGETCEDCISRQAAISAICNACGKIDCDKMDKCEKLQLPPANCSEFPNNSDTISRQAAIDAIAPTIKSILQGNSFKAINVIDKIRNLPSAHERKTGEWYKPVGMMPPEYAGVYRCSKCGEIAMRDWKHHKQVLSNFCPNCGTDMREGQDEKRTND